MSEIQAGAFQCMNNDELKKTSTYFEGLHAETQSIISNGGNF